MLLMEIDESLKERADRRKIRQLSIDLLKFVNLPPRWPITKPEKLATIQTHCQVRYESNSVEGLKIQTIVHLEEY